MKFLIYSPNGEGAGLAYEIQKGGDEAFLYIKDEHSKKALENIVPHVSKREAFSGEFDLVIVDQTKLGAEADQLRKQGALVVSGGKFNDLIEHDRSRAFQIAKSCGIEVPPYESFEGPDTSKAIDLVRKTGKRYVMKPDDDLGCALTYVAKNAEDMIQELTYLGEKKILKGSFLLQEFMEGIEISTEAWFQDGEPIPSLCNSTMEVKKLMADNKGPATGSEFSVVWPYGTDSAKIVRQTVKRLYPVMKQFKYSGPVDVNAIVTEEGKVYFLEFTPRLGYSAIYAFAELMEEGVAEFFWKVAHREVPRLSSQVSTALTLSLPPYPLNPDSPEAAKIFKKTQGKRILKVPHEHFWPFDLTEEEGEWVSGGMHGLLAYVSSIGSDVRDAAEKVYALAEKIEIPDGQYRIDGHERALEDIPKMRQMGYETPNTFSMRDAAAA